MIERNGQLPTICASQRELVLKFGICTLDDLRRASSGSLLSGDRFFNRACYIALYDAVRTADAEAERQAQEAILKRFVTANGTYKRTSRARFDAFDTQLVEVIHASASSAGQPLSIHDVAVSDGRTTCDLYEKLDALLAGRFELFATDLCVRVRSVRRSGSNLIVVVDDDDRPLQIVLPPFVLPLPRTESWLFPVNRVLRAVLLRGPVKSLLDRYARRAQDIVVTETTLVCSETTRLLRERGNLHVERYDLLVRPPRDYQVVRAMNILNPDYFSAEQLARALRNVRESLVEGGVFAVGSNDDAGSTVHGAIYRKRGERFEEMAVSGNGPAIAPLLR
jgi:chemotaxis methyl-accepting protein methylase